MIASVQLCKHATEQSARSLARQSLRPCPCFSCDADDRRRRSPSPRGRGGYGRRRSRSRSPRRRGGSRSPARRGGSRSPPRRRWSPPQRGGGGAEGYRRGSPGRDFRPPPQMLSGVLCAACVRLRQEFRVDCRAAEGELQPLWNDMQPEEPAISACLSMSQMWYLSTHPLMVVLGLQMSCPKSTRSTAAEWCHVPRLLPLAIPVSIGSLVQCADEPPEVGSIHRGRVVSVRPFGVFVELPGRRKQAMIHHSQVQLCLCDCCCSCCSSVCRVWSCNDVGWDCQKKNQF